MRSILLFEEFLTGEVEFKGDRNTITESVKNKKGRLQVTLPVGYTEKPTGNGRIYETEELTKVFESLKSEMGSGAVHGQNGEHPETFFVRPDEMSHIVTEAWVDAKNIIWNKWIIPNSSKGKDLAENFLAGARVGVSIRGRGVEVTEESEGSKFKNFIDSPRIRNYEYGGTDTVGLPSTKIKAGITVPKVEIELISEEEAVAACKNILEAAEAKECSCKKKVDEKFEKSRDEVDRILDKALISQNGDEYTWIKNDEIVLTKDGSVPIEDFERVLHGAGLRNYKADSNRIKFKFKESKETPDNREDKTEEVDMENLKKVEEKLENLMKVIEKSGIKVEEKELTQQEINEDILGQVEAVKTQLVEATKEVEDAKKEVNESKDKVSKNSIDMKKKKAQMEGMEERIQLLDKKVNKYKDYSEKLEQVVEELKNTVHNVADVAEILRGGYLKAEDVIEELVNTNKITANVAESLRSYALVGEDKVKELDGNVKESKEKYEKSLEIIETMKKETKPINHADKRVHEVAGFMMRKNPALQNFKEELLQAVTVEDCKKRVAKYLNYINDVTTYTLKTVNESIKKKGTEPHMRASGFKY